MKTIIKIMMSSMMILAACSFETHGSGNVSVEIRSLEKFTGIELKSVANVYLIQGETQEVKIEAEDNLIQYITTNVKNDELIIDCHENIKTHEPINIYITVKEICLIELSGSGSIVTKNEIQCDHMALRLSGSGDMTVMLTTKALKATLSGSGNMKLNGSSPESSIRISGSGNVNAQQLKTFSSTINITGSGNIKVDVNNELTVSISGSGNVFYLTEPSKVTTKITGSGEVQKI